MLHNDSLDSLFTETILSLLNAQIRNPATGYIFSGTKGLGKELLASCFIAQLLCLDTQSAKACKKCDSCNLNSIALHSDYFEVTKPYDKTVIGIEQIHNLKQSLKTKATISKYLVVLIKDFDLLSISASNALLKILEEPQGKTVFIFLDNRRIKILPTILSRCQQILFRPLPLKRIIAWIEKNGIQKKLAEQIAFLSKNQPAIAIKFLSDSSLLRSRSDEFTSRLNTVVEGNFSSTSNKNYDNDNWAVRQDRAEDVLEDYKYIWHNILLYTLGLETYLKSYNNQTALERFVTNITIEEIDNKISKIEKAIEALTLAVPGDVLLDLIT